MLRPNNEHFYLQLKLGKRLGGYHEMTLSLKAIGHVMIIYLVDLFFSLLLFAGFPLSQLYLMIFGNRNEINNDNGILTTIKQKNKTVGIIQIQPISVH